MWRGHAARGSSNGPGAEFGIVRIGATLRANRLGFVQFVNFISTVRHCILGFFSPALF